MAWIAHLRDRGLPSIRTMRRCASVQAAFGHWIGFAQDEARAAMSRGFNSTIGIIVSQDGIGPSGIGDACLNNAMHALESNMTSLLNRSRRQVLDPLIRKLRSLGVEGDAELEAVLDCIRVRAGTRRGEDIISPGRSSRHSTLLLEGVACLYERLPDGNRQIYAFQYSGDFCDLHRHVLPETNNDIAVAAVTDCSVGIIGHKDLEQLIARYPSLALAFWRASMLEASIFRKRLLNVGRQPALQRVAHLLCEQLARREAVGLDNSTIPLNQMDLADAAGLSIVHVSRTFQELRRLDILSKEGRTIKVVDRERLVRLADFDGNYLNMPQLLSRWHVKIDGAAVSGGSRNSATSSSFDIHRQRTSPSPWRVSSPDRAAVANARAAAGPRFAGQGS